MSIFIWVTLLFILLGLVYRHSNKTMTDHQKRILNIFLITILLLGIGIVVGVWFL